MVGTPINQVRRLINQGLIKDQILLLLSADLLHTRFIMLTAHVCTGGDLLWAFPIFNAGREQFPSLVCSCWPSCHCWVPCPKDGGPPLWLRWWWIHSLALGCPRGQAVHGGVPREILWIWCEGSWQGWPTLFAACLMLLWPLWTHQLHGHSRDGHLYLSCVNLFGLFIRLMFFVMLSPRVHQLMWCTSSRYVCLIRFHCVSLTLCAVGEHSTFDSSSERSCRGGSLSSGEWQQCPGTEQCGLTKDSYVVLSVLLSSHVMFGVGCFWDSKIILNVQSSLTCWS